MGDMHKMTSSSGMDALVSAIEYERRAVQGARYDPKTGAIVDPNDSLNRARLYSGTTATSYASHVPYQVPTLPPGVSQPPFVGINPMFLPFMSPMLNALRPTVSSQPQHSPSLAWVGRDAPSQSESRSEDSKETSVHLYKCTVCGKHCVDHTDLRYHIMHYHMRTSSPYHPGSSLDHHHHQLMQDNGVIRNDSRAMKSSHDSAGNKNDLARGMSSYMHPSSAELSVFHENAAKSLQSQNATLNPYLALNYQSLLPGGAASTLLPSMLPAGWNPSLSFPYYQPGLLPRMPFIPSSQSPMLRMPLNSVVANVPPQSLTPDLVPTSASPKSIPPSRLDPSRPQSGGFLPIKETVERRLSAPVLVSGGSPRLSGIRSDNLQKNKYFPGYGHGGHFPLIGAASPDLLKSGRSPVSNNRPDARSIEQHISELISHNEKVLLNPRLDKVKPRRVFRRSSLDPSSLSSTPAHNPLTPTYSAPRTMEPMRSKGSSEEKSPIHCDRLSVNPAHLGFPQRQLPGLTKSNSVGSATPLRDNTGAKLLDSEGSSAVLSGYEMINQRAKAVTQELYQSSASVNMAKRCPGESNFDEDPKRLRESLSFTCEDCNEGFPKREHCETHRQRCCTKRKISEPALGVSRQSVIQHTGGQPEPRESDSTQSRMPDYTVIPQVSITPATELPEPSKLHKDEEVMPIASSSMLINPLHLVHRDVYRTRSADAALQTSIKIKNQYGDTESVVESSSPNVASSNTACLKLPSPTKSPKSDEVFLKLNASELSIPHTKSSIPTDKLPPKKKQLQLMRSNSSNQTLVEPSRSPEFILNTKERKLPNTYLIPGKVPCKGEDSHNATSPHQAGHPHRSLPPWISLDQSNDEEYPTSLGLPASSPSTVAYCFSTATNYLPSSVSSTIQSRVTTTSSTSWSSQRSPTRRLSPGRSPTRSPLSSAHSPTSSGSLESTIPRSNYKLLLHQISLRNMQDISYLSEAFHNSKDKDLKRNIASLLWSSVGPYKMDGGLSSKRAYVDSKMEDLYPGKASLARRLSPNLNTQSSSSSRKTGSLRFLASDDSRLDARSSRDQKLGRSHSSGVAFDVNNNIKQYLQNKNKKEQIQNQESALPPSKTHRPLRRLNANARYLLNSPTGMSSGDSELPRMTMEGAVREDDNLTASERLKESLSLKRASSCDLDTSQSKRTKTSVENSSRNLSHSLSSSAVPRPSCSNEHVTRSSHRESAEQNISVDTTQSMRMSSLLYPHLTPNFVYEPHPTFCSLLSPQPTYVELKQSLLSMYSQWAVSDPLMLPKDLGVMDLFRSLKFVKPLSPYISYSSLFVDARPKKDEFLKVTDTKEREEEVKKKELKAEKMSRNEPQDNDQIGAKTETVDSAEVQNWMMSKMLKSSFNSSLPCYTTCHDKSSLKLAKERKLKAKESNVNVKQTKSSNQNFNNYKKNDGAERAKQPKFQLPTVVVHPPSPVSPESPGPRHSPPLTQNLNGSSSNNEISALEVSDSESDDSYTDKPAPSEHFLSENNQDATEETSNVSRSGLEDTVEVATVSESKSPLSQDSHEENEEVNLGMVRKSTADNRKMENSAQNETFTNSSVRSEGSDNSLEDDCRQSSGSDQQDVAQRKNKKIRKSRKKRNSSPRQQKRINQQMPDSPTSRVFEDPSLAVHPTGACRGSSDDPLRTCALCSMKAGGASKCISQSQADTHGAVEDMENKPGDAVESNIIDEEPIVKTEPSSQDRSPSRPRTPAPLTVTVPKRNRDRSSVKKTKKSLAPGILDKSRGKGTTTQHWVTTSDLKSSLSPSVESQRPEIKQEELIAAETGEKKSKINDYDKVFQNSESYSAMPPNKNPVLELQTSTLKTSEQSGGTITTTSGQHTLAEVVCGVIRSAAIQSKQKTKTAKQGINEMLSHSRPLIPTSELSGSSNKDQSSREDSNTIKISHKRTGSLGSASGTGHKMSVKISQRHLTLSSRESELFISKTNEMKDGSVLENVNRQIQGTDSATQQQNSISKDDMTSELDHDYSEEDEMSPNCGNFQRQTSDEQAMHDGDDATHSDDAKDDCLHEGDNESTNPRPHKCLECKVAFRIAGHLAKHLRSKGHIIAMQKKTLNRLKQQHQKFAHATTENVSNGGQGVVGSLSSSNAPPSISDHQQLSPNSQLESGKYAGMNQEEILNQLVEGAETLARAQVRALFEGNDEYAEIVTSTNQGSNVGSAIDSGVSDMGEEGEDKFMSSLSTQLGSGVDPRPFKCIACKVAFRFQGHLDRHFRSNMHLLAVGHFERDKGGNSCTQSPITHLETVDTMDPASEICDPNLDDYQAAQSAVNHNVSGNNLANEAGFCDTGNKDIPLTESQMSDSVDQAVLEEGRVIEESSFLKTKEIEQKNMYENDVNINDHNNNYNTSSHTTEPIYQNGPSLQTHQSEAGILNQPDSLVSASPNHDFDSPRRSPVPSSAQKVQKEPINGLSPHVISLNEQSTNGIVTSDKLFANGSELSKTSKDFNNLKQRLSPVIQSNSKTIFENPPPILEGPIQSNSSVHSRQQLTC